MPATRVVKKRFAKHVFLLCQTIAWGRIVSCRVYQLMSGCTGSGFFPGSAAPRQGGPTATSALLARGVSSLRDFSVGLSNSVQPGTDTASVEIFQQRCTNLFCSISSVRRGPSHAICG